MLNENFRKVADFYFSRINPFLLLLFVLLFVTHGLTYAYLRHTGIVKSQVIAPNSVLHEKGNAYTFKVSFREYLVLDFGGDTLSAPWRSNLVLLEDGKKLGSAHTLQDDIRNMGNGAYSHWNNILYFAASDNTDPRSNGREYKISISAGINILGAIISFAGAIVFSLPVLWKIRRWFWQGGGAQDNEQDIQVSAASSRSRRKSNWRRMVRRIASFLFIAGITVAGLEVAAGFYLHTAKDLPLEESNAHIFSPYRGHELRPGKAYKPGSHSEQGFRRDTAVSLEKPLRTFRIFVLGGSALYGVGAGGKYPYAPPLKNSEGIDFAIESSLNEKLLNIESKWRVEVINAGVIGYWTFQHLVYINEALVHYDPDFFVFLDGTNDFFRSKTEFNHWRDYPYSSVVITDFVNKPTLLFGAQLLARAIPFESQFVELLQRILTKKMRDALVREAQTREYRGKQLSFEDLDAGYPVYANETYLRVYLQIQALARQIKAGMMVFLQPWIIHEDRSNLGAKDNRILDITLGLGTNPKYIKKAKRLIPGLFKSADIPFHDLGSIGDKVQDENQLYIDYTHLTPEGAGLVGRLMAEKLWPEVLGRIKNRSPGTN